MCLFFEPYEFFLNIVSSALLLEHTHLELLCFWWLTIYHYITFSSIFADYLSSEFSLFDINTASSAFFWWMIYFPIILLSMCLYHYMSFFQTAYYVVFIHSTNFLKTKIFLIYMWLLWIFIALWGLSLVVAIRGYSSLWCMGFSLQWLLLLGSMSSRAHWLQLLWHMGLVALRHMGSSWTRDRTCGSHTGRWTPIHWATREVPFYQCFLSILQKVVF